MSNFESATLVTQKRLNAQQKKNIKLCKKKEGGKHFFDRKAKIYKLLRADGELLDLVGEEEVAYPKSLPPINATKLLQILKDKDVKGMSGNGMPAYRKLGAFLFSQKQNGILLVNAVACDPALAHDDWLLTHKQEEILLGISVLRQACGFSRIVLASHQKKLRIPNRFNIEFKTISYRYPAGEERYLLREALGVSLRQDELPVQSQILVYNVQTVLMIGRAALGRNVNFRYLTLADFEKGTAKVCKAPYGYSVPRLIGENCPSVENGLTPFFGGSAFSVQPVQTSSTVTAQTNLAALAKRLQFAPITACTNCGACREKCPLSLGVDGVMQSLKNRKPFALDTIDACIGCGACAYFCKANIDVLSVVTSLKNQRR